MHSSRHNARVAWMLAKPGSGTTVECGTARHAQRIMQDQNFGPNSPHVIAEEVRL